MKFHFNENNKELTLFIDRKPGIYESITVARGGGLNELQEIAKTIKQRNPLHTVNIDTIQIKTGTSLYCLSDIPGINAPEGISAVLNVYDPLKNITYKYGISPWKYADETTYFYEYLKKNY